MTTLDEVYAERNNVIALAATLAHESGYPVWRAKHTAPDWEDDWRNIIYIVLPTGQLSWHIHDSDVPLFAHLRQGENTWDGHTTPEKYERLREFATNPIRWHP